MKRTIFYRMVEDFIKKRWNLYYHSLYLGKLDSGNIIILKNVPRLDTLYERIIWVIERVSEYQTFEMLGNSYEYQCRLGARRSMIDIYRILKTYYPGHTLYDVIFEFQKMVGTNQPFEAIFCGDIERFVVRKSTLKYQVNAEVYTEFGFRISDKIYEVEDGN